jgi:hypothetical protein
MYKWGFKNGNNIHFNSILLLSVLFLLLTGCRSNMGESEKSRVNGKNLQGMTPDIISSYVKFRSYQNPDSTWGYTIFVNSRPYMHYSRIHLKKYSSGFSSKKDADMVAELIVKMIQNGTLEPKLDEKTLDSLYLKMDRKK